MKIITVGIDLASALSAVTQTLPALGMDQAQRRAQGYDVPRGTAAHAGRWAH